MRAVAMQDNDQQKQDEYNQRFGQSSKYHDTSSRLLKKDQDYLKLTGPINSRVPNENDRFLVTKEINSNKQNKQIVDEKNKLYEDYKDFVKYFDFENGNKKIEEIILNNNMVPSNKMEMINRINEKQRDQEKRNEEINWHNYHAGYKKRSNKKRSNKKRSYKKRSYKKRSNKKR